MTIETTDSNLATGTATTGMKCTVILIKDKGGAGASLATVGIAENLREMGGTRWQTIVLDADPTTFTTTSRLAQRDGRGDFLEEQSLANGVITFDLADPSQGGMILDIAAQDARYIVIDCPAGALSKVDKLTDNLTGLDVVEAHQAAGRTVVVMVPITPMLSSVSNVSKAFDAFGPRANYVVIRNMYGGDADAFGLFDSPALTDAWGNVVSGNAKARLLEGGGKVIDLPRFDPGTYAIVDALGLSLRAAMDHARLPASRKMTVRNWLKAWRRQLMLLGPSFGFDVAEMGDA